MKHLVLFSLLLFVSSFIIDCAPQGESPEQMIAAAKDLDQRFVEAYNRGDVDGVMATYWNSPDLVSYPPDAMEFRGWQATKAGLEKTFSGTPGATLEIFDANNRVVGDVVIGSGRWRVSIPVGEDPPMQLQGRYTDVKAKKDGKWVYIMDHASAPIPPPETIP